MIFHPKTEAASWNIHERIKQQLTGSDEYKYYVNAYFMHVCV